MQLCDTAFTREGLTTALMIGFVCFVALLVVFVLQVPEPANFDWVSGWPAVAHVRHLGYYAAAIIGLCIGRFAIVISRPGWMATFAVATLAFALALWTGTRGAIAAAGAGLAVGMLLFPALRRRQVLLGVLGSSVVSVALVAWLPTPAGHLGLWRTVAATVSRSEAGIGSGRTDLWLRTLNAISQRPLFGYGDGQTFWIVPFEPVVGQPHNVLLQALLAWGVIGTACILILTVPFAIRTACGIRALGGEWLPPFLAMLVLAAYSAFDGTLYYTLPLSIFAACAGLVARGVLVRGSAMDRRSSHVSSVTIADARGMSPLS
jgi:O-antigen ligase